ncbi:MAG TPA: amidase, partial [Dehalococcoidia bacterium]|nr:amidase [Dehalococcoidia bacterium]
MPETPLHFKTIREVAALIESKQLSPVELTRTMLERIGALDGKLLSYATLMADSAMAQAREAEHEIAAGSYRGLLHGVPVAVKDLCYTTGVRTMGGTKVNADFIPHFDATVVTRLKAAGAVILGKLNLTEGAMGGYHPALKIPKNPWNVDSWSGASSSGSGVATAAGLCFGSLGSDTGGSIRFPASACGTVGLKPTYGRVSRYGVLALGQSLDHVGPLTRSAADAGIVLQAIAGQDPNDATSLPDPVPDMLDGIHQGVRGMRIGWNEAYATSGVDPEVVSAVRAALKV